MEKLKQHKYIILIVLLTLGFSFYWFQLRPSIIARKCDKEAVERAKKVEESLTDSITTYNARYKSCLRGEGIDD